MRMIETHHDGHGLNEVTYIYAGPTGPGGSSHKYTVTIRDLYPEIPGNTEDVKCAEIQFQQGPRNEETSKPGITSSVLYAILLDHLQGFQNGPYPHVETGKQIALLRECLASTKARADERAARNVLGTYAE